MRIHPFGPIELDQCQGCGGTFYDVGEIQSLVQAELVWSEDAWRAIRQVVTQTHAPPGPKGRLSCPVCQKLMNQKNYLRASGVLLDMCHQHGAFLTHDATYSLFEFIAKGGPERVGQMMARRMEEEKRAGIGQHNWRRMSAHITPEYVERLEEGDWDEDGGDLLDPLFDFAGYLWKLFK
jgi:Zn-finger nucleic acid-binding protein